MRYDINFGAGLWEIKITSFNYNVIEGMFHITLERGFRVEQFNFSAF